ncbi:nucleotidyltransferase family protein [Syntrophobotulus glycolicus]|nr:nucleotidyltransferase family protein [Syntrophobotulus glycolicus]
MLDKNVFEKLQEYKPILEERYSVGKIGVFGSYARNEQKEDSDIDIIVEFTRPVGFQFIDLKLYLEEILERKVDLVTPNALKSQIREQVLKEVTSQ